MNKTSQRIASWLLLTFMAQMLMGCASITTNNPDNSKAAGLIESPNPDYAGAQATMDNGQSQLLDMSHKATDVSLGMSQAAATQRFIMQQTNVANDATAVAQRSAAAATQSAYLVKVTQTAQAQAILDTQVSHTAQAVVALTAYPLTATPFAVTQAALLMQQYDREQQTFVDHFVTPFVPVLVILNILLYILVLVLAYRRFMPMIWPNGLFNGRINNIPRPLTMVDGVIVNHDPRLNPINPSKLASANPPGLPGENTAHVEIMDAYDAPVAHWIAEVEHQLDAEGGQSL